MNTDINYGRGVQCDDNEVHNSVNKQTKGEKEREIVKMQTNTETQDERNEINNRERWLNNW